jgi:hypothetical protein
MDIWRRGRPVGANRRPQPALVVVSPIVRGQRPAHSARRGSPDPAESLTEGLQDYAGDLTIGRPTRVLRRPAVGTLCGVGDPRTALPILPAARLRGTTGRLAGLRPGPGLRRTLGLSSGRFTSCHVHGSYGRKELLVSPPTPRRGKTLFIPEATSNLLADDRFSETCSGAHNPTGSPAFAAPRHLS